MHITKNDLHDHTVILHPITQNWHIQFRLDTTTNSYYPLHTRSAYIRRYLALLLCYRTPPCFLEAFQQLPVSGPLYVALVFIAFPATLHHTVRCTPSTNTSHLFSSPENYFFLPSRGPPPCLQLFLQNIPHLFFHLPNLSCQELYGHCDAFQGAIIPPQCYCKYHKNSCADQERIFLSSI